VAKPSQLIPEFLASQCKSLIMSKLNTIVNIFIKGETVNIILGKERAESLSQKYVVLELDTLKFNETGLVIESYCVVENIQQIK
jgi:hypothetical protein